jgi:hypothetical protein
MLALDKAHSLLLDVIEMDQIQNNTDFMDRAEKIADMIEDLNDDATKERSGGTATVQPAEEVAA